MSCFSSHTQHFVKKGDVKWWHYNVALRFVTAALDNFFLLLFGLLLWPNAEHLSWFKSVSGVEKSRATESKIKTQPNKTQENQNTQNNTQHTYNPIHETIHKTQNT